MIYYYACLRPPSHVLTTQHILANEALSNDIYQTNIIGHILHSTCTKA
jgi:hypothetical protein